MRNAIIALLTLAAGLHAQPSGSLTFEVATIKPSAPPEQGKPMFFGTRGGPGTADPGQITATRTTLKAILMNAYDVRSYQITGPPWIDNDPYDIIAKVPAGTTKDQVKVMWQNLLAERFGVTLHHQSKVFEVEEMQIVKAVKLKETTLDPNAPDAQPPAEPPTGAILTGGPGRFGGPGAPPPAGLPPFSPPKMDKNGVPELTAPGLVTMMTVGPNGPTARMVGKAQTTAQLAISVGNQIDKPVVDKTGLTGKYDFVLEFAPDPTRFRAPPGVAPGPGGQTLAGQTAVQSAGGETNATEPSGLTFVGALQQQLGLRLVSTKAPLDTIVIDHAEKAPTAN